VCGLCSDCVWGRTGRVKSGPSGLLAHSQMEAAPEDWRKTGSKLAQIPPECAFSGGLLMSSS